MDNQGLRQPQFSEDSPWLPTWLQPECVAFGEQTMSSHPICETECKALGPFPRSMEYLEEAIHDTPTEEVMGQICPLFLSGDDCTATEGSQSSEIALALHLSFSSDDNSECCAAKFIGGPSQEAYQSHAVLENHIFVPNTQLEFAGKINQNMHPIPSAVDFNGVKEDLMCGKVLTECQIPTQSHTQQTPCTELYVPGIIQQENNLNDTICDTGYDLEYIAGPSELLAKETSRSSLDGTLGSESSVPGRTVIENVQNSLKRQSRKRKSIDKSEGQLSDKITDSKLTSVDIDVAIGLTVAAAEALVISNLMETCMLSEGIGCSEILEAALKLKQARQICGLDRFLDVSSRSVDSEDSSLDDLDDSVMKEAFADVGLFELGSMVSPAGACCADAVKSGDAEEYNHDNTPSFLSRKEELIGDFDEKDFTPSKQELKGNGSGSREDNGIILCETIASIPDPSISRCLTSVKAVEDQRRDSMEILHLSLEPAAGEPIIHTIDAKPSGVVMSVASMIGKSENSLSGDLGIIGSQEKPSSPLCKKCNEQDSFQSEFLSMDKLLHNSDKRENAAVETAVGIVHFNKQFDRNGNTAVETAAGNTHFNKQIHTIDKESNCACPTGDAVCMQSSVTCSPSWLSLAGDRVKEIISGDASQLSDSLGWQSHIPAAISCKTESEKSHDTAVTRFLSIESQRPFNSRWFGGWTGLEKETQINKTFEATMYVQKPFVEETSYLSESLDMDIEHATSVRYDSSEALKQPLNIDCDILDMDIQDLSSSNKAVCNTLSQTSVWGSNSSLYDPLCSVVPCSLDQEDGLLTKNTDIVDGQRIDPILSSKVHTDTSLQLHEGLRPLLKESTTQLIAGCFLSPSLSLNKPSQQWHNKETEFTRTNSIGCESQVCGKRKRVDSLKQYSTVSGVMQNGSKELSFETKDKELPRRSVMIPSVEGLKRDYPSGGTVTSIKDKKNVNKEAALPRELGIQASTERLARDCASANTVNGILGNNQKVIGKFADYDMLEFESLPMTKVIGDSNALCEKDSSCGKQSTFQDQCKGVATIQNLTSGNLEENNDISTIHKSSCNLGTELEVRLDVEESSPLLLDCRKRRRLRAYKTIESGTSEDSNWDKNTSTCMKHSVAAVSHNINDFEPAKNLCHFPDLHLQESIEHSSSKLQGGDIKIKRVHFSEDITKIQEDAGGCQKGPLQNTSTQFCQTHEVCGSVPEKMNHFVMSFRVQNAKVGKKTREGNCRRDKRENAERELRFEGLEFLLTGLSKNKKNKLEALIRKHGGIVLSNLPSLSHARLRGLQKTQCLARKCPIIISAQQVRTTKFLYGCAVGSLLLQPSWITDSIAAKCCLPYDKYLLTSKVSNVGQWQKHSNTVENAIPLFRGIRIMLYGKPAFYSKLMILIKHAGGQVFRTIKSLLQGCEYTRAASAMIIVEDARAAPRNLRQCASEYRIPLMSGNWIIESLLLGRLLPFRTNTSSGSRSSGKRGRLQNSLIKKSSECWNRSEPIAARLLGSNNTDADNLISLKDVKGPVRKEDTLNKESTITCGLEVSVTPPEVPKLGIMLPRKYAEHSAKQQHRSNCLYYKKVAFKDVLYSIGDVVELVHISEAEESHLARIECLWCEQTVKVKARLRKRKEVVNSCGRLFLQCRWFYRPSDTGFPCTGSGKEIYLSNCFKDIPVQRIIKKVSVVFMVDGMIFPMNATNEKEGDRSSCITEYEQTTDFICNFFYDYETESLHQLKI